MKIERDFEFEQFDHGGRKPDRETLAAALARPRRRSFAEVLASMPEVGADADFERAGSSGRAPDVSG